MTPRWQQISDELGGRLRDGAYTDGFPGELALCEEFGVSRGTIRQALRPLRERGLVSAGRGRRPQVSSSYVVNTTAADTYGPLYSITEAIRATGAEEISKVLIQELGTWPTIAGLIGRAPDTELFHVMRVRCADGVPFAVDRVWFDAAVAGPLVGEDLTQAGVYEKLREVCDVELAGGTERTWAISAPAELAEHLQIEEGDAVLRTRRLGCLDGKPVEFRDTLAAGSRMTLTHDFGDPDALYDCGRKAGPPAEVPIEFP